MFCGVEKARLHCGIFTDQWSVSRPFFHASSKNWRPSSGFSARSAKTTRNAFRRGPLEPAPSNAAPALRACKEWSRPMMTKFTRFAIAAGVAGALIVPATSAQARTSQTERALLGAVLGGVAGAALGHGDGDAVAVGAVAGAALGAVTTNDNHRRSYTRSYRTTRPYAYDHQRQLLPRWLLRWGLLRRLQQRLFERLLRQLRRLPPLSPAGQTDG